MTHDKTNVLVNPVVSFHGVSRLDFAPLKALSKLQPLAFIAGSFTIHRSLVQVPDGTQLEAITLTIPCGDHSAVIISMSDEHALEVLVKLAKAVDLGEGLGGQNG